MAGVQTDGQDQYAGFRAELGSRRIALGLRATDAARRARVSPDWWRHVERGYQGSRRHKTPANPSRETIVAMAKALDWAVEDALRCAGEPPLTGAEAHQVGTELRAELAQCAKTLTDAQVALLLAMARMMYHPGEPMPRVGPPAPGNPTPAKPRAYTSGTPDLGTDYQERVLAGRVGPDGDGHTSDEQQQAPDKAVDRVREIVLAITSDDEPGQSS